MDIVLQVAESAAEEVRRACGLVSRPHVPHDIPHLLLGDDRGHRTANTELLVRVEDTLTELGEEGREECEANGDGADRSDGAYDPANGVAR